MENTDKLVETKSGSPKMFLVLAVLFGTLTLIFAALAILMAGQTNSLKRVVQESQRQLALAKNTTPAVTNKVKTENRILKEVELKGFKIKAEDFYSSDDSSIFGYVKVSVADGVSDGGLIVSGSWGSDTDFSMQIVGGKLWVMNAHNRAIDMFDLVTDEAKTYADLKYEGSIVVPEYVLGRFQSFVCSGTKCVVSFSRIESGCDLEYDIVSGKFSNMKCTDTPLG